MMFSYVLSEEKMHDKRDDDQTKPQQQQNESGHICYTNTNIKVGMKVPADYDGASHTVTSGWMNDRIDEMVRGIEESCGDFDGWLEEKDTTTHGC